MLIQFNTIARIVLYAPELKKTREYRMVRKETGEIKNFIVHQNLRHVSNYSFDVAFDKKSKIRKHINKISIKNQDRGITGARSSGSVHEIQTCTVRDHKIKKSENPSFGLR